MTPETESVIGKALLSRWSIAQRITDNLRQTLSCDNLRQDTQVAGWPVEYTLLAVEKMPYLHRIHQATDYGVELFPYLYGVLQCPQGDGEICHCYHEPLGQPWDTLVLTKPSDWYSVCYQVLTLADYEESVLRWVPTTPLGGLYYQTYQTAQRSDYTVVVGAEETHLRLYHSVGLRRWSSESVPLEESTEWTRRVAGALRAHMEASSITPTPKAINYVKAVEEGVPLTECLVKYYARDRQ